MSFGAVPAVCENKPKGPLPFHGAQYHQAILKRTARKKRGAPAQKSYTVTNEDGLLQVTPHQIRRVFERRNAQKPEFYGVRRFAKRNWNRRTQRYRHTLVRV
jgi:hypothetical protein